MGKQHKQWKKQMKREGKLVDKGRPHRGACFKDGCEERGGEIIHCRTCEALVAAGKRNARNIYTVQHCVLHTDDAIAKAKAHALLAHPYNLLKVTVAALKGEGI